MLRLQIDRWTIYSLSWSSFPSGNSFSRRSAQSKGKWINEWARNGRSTQHRSHYSRRFWLGRTSPVTILKPFSEPGYQSYYGRRNYVLQCVHTTFHMHIIAVHASHRTLTWRTNLRQGVPPGYGNSLIWPGWLKIWSSGLKSRVVAQVSSASSIWVWAEPFLTVIPEVIAGISTGGCRSWSEWVKRSV